MPKMCPHCKSKRVEYDGYEYRGDQRALINKCRKCGYAWINAQSWVPIPAVSEQGEKICPSCEQAIEDGNGSIRCHACGWNVES